MAGLHSAESHMLGVSTRYDNCTLVCARGIRGNWETEQDHGGVLWKPTTASRLPTHAWASGKPMHCAYLPKSLIHCWGTSWHLEVISSDQQRTIITAKILYHLRLDSTISESFLDNLSSFWNLIEDKYKNKRFFFFQHSKYFIWKRKDILISLRWHR